MAQYENYKLTYSLGFEKIPEEWNLKKVKYLFNIGRGRVISQEELMDNGLYPVFSSQTQNNGCLGYINTFDFDCEQLTWTTDGANAGTVFIRSGKHNCTNVCGTLQPIKNQAHLKFSHYALQYATQFHKRPDTNGAKIMNNEMAEISFALPSQQEQFKIVEYLNYETSKIDSLIAKQEKLIELLKEKRQAVISHAVTKGLNPEVAMKDSGVEWLEQVPEHWEVSTIGYYAKVTNGTTPSKANLSYWDKEEIPWLSSGEVNQYYIVEASEYITAKALAECSLELLPIGTVVMGMIGQGKTRGLSAITEIEATINQNLAALVTYPKLNNEYLHYYLQAAYDYMREEGRGGNQAALNCEIIRKFPITIPPSEEQLQIVEKIKKLSITYKALIHKAESAIQLMQERRTALISSAVTGKVDVRNWQDPNEAKTGVSA